MPQHVGSFLPGALCSPPTCRLQPRRDLDWTAGGLPRPTVVSCRGDEDEHEDELASCLVLGRLSQFTFTITTKSSSDTINISNEKHKFVVYLLCCFIIYLIFGKFWSNLFPLHFITNKLIIHKIQHCEHDTSHGVSASCLFIYINK